MKSSLLMLIVIFAFAACNKKGDPKTNEPGDVRVFDPIMVQEHSNLKITLQNVCAALELKQNDLEDYVGRDELAVTYQESECGGKLPSPTRTDVRVWKRDGQYVFQNEAGNFGMTEVETLNSGIMKEICANLVGIQNPMTAGNGSQLAIEFQMAETSECRNDSQRACLVILKGKLSQSGESFTVNDSTLISFRTVLGGRTGFYTYKSVKTYGSCPSGSFRTKTARFL